MWLNELLKITDSAETPRPWIYWSGLAAIAAVTGPNVYLDKFYYKLSPNIYVMLIGKSGLGKGLGPWMAKTLVEMVDTTRVIAGRNSIQHIIQDLGRTKSREGKEMITDGRAFLISGEFANFAIADPNTTTILTEWYDTHYMGEWKNSLKSGLDKIKGLNITLLGASSPSHFREFVADRDIEGGFIGRTLLIYAEKRHRINPLVDKPEEFITVEAIKHLADYLVELSKIKGQFAWSDGAKQTFSDWYHEFRGTERDDKTGTDQRFHDHVCKVAMLLSLSRGTSLVISPEDIQDAIKSCTNLTASINRALIGKGKSQLATQTAQVINILLRHPEGMSRTKILQMCWGDMDAFDLDKIEVTLSQANGIFVKTKGDEKHYKLVDRFREQYEEFIKKKKDEK